MTRGIIGAALIILTLGGNSQQPDVQYLISGRFLAGNLQDARPMQLLTAPVLRLAAGAMTMSSFDADDFRLRITATELAAGKIALHVVF
jgi:hypothetical protein